MSINCPDLILLTSLCGILQQLGRARALLEVGWGKIVVGVEVEATGDKLVAQVTPLGVAWLGTNAIDGSKPRPCTG